MHCVCIGASKVIIIVLVIYITGNYIPNRQGVGGCTVNNLAPYSFGENGLLVWILSNSGVDNWVMCSCKVKVL